LAKQFTAGSFSVGFEITDWLTWFPRLDPG